MKYILAQGRDIEEHKQICNQIYFEAVNTPLSCAKNAVFTVEELSKTNKQLRGYWRLICLILPYLKEAYKGEISNKNEASDFIKIQCNYCREIKTKTKVIILAKSLKEITKEKMKELIEKIYEVCEFFNIKNYELRPEEERLLMEYFNN